MPGQPRLTAAWVEAVNQGIAGDLCDRIVQARDVPKALAWLYEQATAEHVPILLPPAGDRLVHRLTRRQREVLYLASFGWHDGNIAAALALAPGTVNDHFVAIFARLETDTRSEAVAIGLREFEII